MNLENDAAQVEAEKCAVIAKDVTELQARCEKDLAAAEPLVAMAEAALDTLNKKDLGEFTHGMTVGACLSVAKMLLRLLFEPPEVSLVLLQVRPSL